MSLPATTRKHGLAASTIRTRFNYVHIALRAAVRDRLIVENPAERMKLSKQRRRHVAMTIPAPDQAAKALDAASREFGAFVAPKAGSERDMPIPESLTDTLTDHLTSVGAYGEEGWLFQSGNALLNRNSASHQWQLIRAEVAMAGFSLHDVRHFYASGLIPAGCDVATVQRAIGHASASITLNTYSQLWPTGQDRHRSAAADLMRKVGCIGCGLCADSRPAR